MTQMQLKPSSILNVPLSAYDDFLFVVNGETFKTSRIVSDLLSPVICSIHSTDPTIDTFTINTRHQGNFSLILNLSHFNQVNIPENEIPFISEVIEILNNKSVEILNNKSVEIQFQSGNSEITVDNVFTLIKQHEQIQNFYFDRFSEEIDFISSHFHEICETHEEEMRNLHLNTILRILNNSELQLNSEDQLLKFVNDLYNIDTKYSILYETVYFLNVSSQMMKEFLSIYDMNFLTASTWQNLSKRLEEEVDIKSDSEQENKRYKNQSKKKKDLNFPVNPNQDFNGIFNYLKKNSNINNEIDISVSSSGSSEIYLLPKNVFLFQDDEKCFLSKDTPNSWICFDFKDRKVIPTNYTIKTGSYWRINSYHPMNWQIQGSNDQNSWEIIDEVKNCSLLNGPNITHTFEIKNKCNDSFKYIRIYQNGPTYNGHNNLIIGSFEIYGTLI